MLVERIGWGSTTWRPPRLHKAGFRIVARESTGGTTARSGRRGCRPDRLHLIADASAPRGLRRRGGRDPTGCRPGPPRAALRRKVLVADRPLEALDRQGADRRGPRLSEVAGRRTSVDHGVPTSTPVGQPLNYDPADAGPRGSASSRRARSRAAWTRSGHSRSAGPDSGRAEWASWRAPSYLTMTEDAPEDLVEEGGLTPRSAAGATLSHRRLGDPALSRGCPPRPRRRPRHCAGGVTPVPPVVLGDDGGQHGLPDRGRGRRCEAVCHERVPRRAGRQEHQARLGAELPGAEGERARRAVGECRAPRGLEAAGQRRTTGLRLHSSP